MAPFVSGEQSQRMELNRLKAIGIRNRKLNIYNFFPIVLSLLTLVI